MDAIVPPWRNPPARRCLSWAREALSPSEANVSLAGIVSGGHTWQLAKVLQRNYQQVRGEFKQLGQDLQAGNMAQGPDQLGPPCRSPAASQFGSNSPVSKTLNTPGQALRNVTMLQPQNSVLFFPVGMVGPCAEPHHGRVGRTQDPFGQAMNQLGQALQSGNLSAAQQAIRRRCSRPGTVAPDAIPVPRARVWSDDRTFELQLVKVGPY